MRLLANLFSLSNYRKSIPNSWCGFWADKNGKQIVIESTKHDIYDVSVLDANGQPYEIELLEGNKRDTIRLTGRFATDTNGNPILQVEAGSNDIGPTYNLYFLTAKRDQELRRAKNFDDLDYIIIRPNVGLGLYDDWDDDLGVPWAFPLEDFKKF